MKWEQVIASKNPKYLNSLTYVSKDWRFRKELTVDTPVQREILPNEIVADFDNISEENAKKVFSYFLKSNYLFAYFKSSDTGMHIHFFCNVRNKHNKFGVLKLIEEDINIKDVKIDAQVVKRGIIRAENSIHPEKKTKKTLVYSNVSLFNYINELPVEMLIKSSNFRPQVVTRHTSDETPKCVKFILSNTFSDGRQRLVFLLSSWYKGQGLNESEVFTKVKEWTDRQNYNLSDYVIKSTIQSSQGCMTCSGRHELLSELGFDVMCN